MKGRVNYIAVAVLTVGMLSNNVIAAEDALSPDDMDLIEFLGGWESEDGEWLDPALFDDAFLGDAVVIEGESILQKQDLKSREIQKKGNSFSEEGKKAETPGMKKEKR